MQIKLTLRGPSTVQTSQRVVDRLGLHDTDESDSGSAPTPPVSGRKRPAEEPATAAARPAKVRDEVSKFANLVGKCVTR